MSDVAIKVEDLGKQYRIGGPQAHYKTLRDSITNAMAAPFRRAAKLLRGHAYGAAELDETIWALKDVSFEVRRGDVMGIIGRNGAGKSTLLKILSRITEPTEGKAKIYGRVGSLLEVGTGFHSELTGRENIFLNGAILGMKKAEIERKFDEIVAFSEIEKFIDTPVKHFSSGMYMRLAFAVASHMDPEILIVDEVLAVGDAQFQKKCLGKMHDVSEKEGRTVLFVSHNMGAITTLCKNAILLEGGQIKSCGAVLDTVDKYLNGDSLNRQQNLEWKFPPDEKRTLSEIVKIHRYSIQGEDGSVSSARLYSSKKYNVVIDAEIVTADSNLAFYISYYTKDDVLLFISDIHDAGQENMNKLKVGNRRLITSVPGHLFLNGIYKVELSCVVHYKGWPLIPNNGQRLTFEFIRDNNKNCMGYDEANHPFNAGGKLGLICPVIEWEVF